MNEKLHNISEHTDPATANEFTAAEADIRFDPAAEQEAKTAAAVAAVKKPRRVKWYFLIPLILLGVMGVLLAGWYIQPKTRLNVCLLDKTVLTVQDGSDIDIHSAYRKHQGLFWLLEQQRYVFEDGQYYNYKTDYFGPQLDATGQIRSVRELSTLDYTPDLMYVADVYGAVDDTYGYYQQGAARDSGITVDDMSVISYAYENGAAVVAEMELFNSNLDSSVYSQLSSLCGIKPTGWVGRYIYDLQDFTDVPDWAPPMYEKQEGVAWRFSGPGILLVSADKILVLEQKTDFDSKNLLRVRVNEAYKKEFRQCSRVNFYNWFEIVEPNNDTDVIASFSLDVNATGMEKLKGVLQSPSFAAVMCKRVEGKAPVYYFAGDFNDYVSRENYNRFLFADRIFRWISYDRQGDISHFYWNFYTPLMKKILADITPLSKDGGTGGGTSFRVSDSGFQRLEGEQWTDIPLNAISINGSEPGKTGYSRNYTYYQSLIDEAVKLGANALYVKDMLPPEFYRAVYARNTGAGAEPLYVIQNVALAGDEPETTVRTRLQAAVDALHGQGSFRPTGSNEDCSYFIDLSGYLLGMTVSAAETPAALTYSGQYASGSGVGGFAALVYDVLQTQAGGTYGGRIPVGVQIPAARIAGSALADADAYALRELIADATCREQYAFTAVSLDSLRAARPAEEPDAETLRALNVATGQRLLLTGLGTSSAVGQGARAAITEKTQGQQTVELLRTAHAAGVLAAVAADLNDDWSAVSAEYAPFTVPLDNNPLWQNGADPAQNTGLVALDAAAPTQTGINLADDDRVQMLSLSSGAGYFYITAQLLTEIDHSTEQLFLGIDTYQRNDGEYYYSKGFTSTALSGMEFVLRFENKQEAGLYVMASYDRSQGAYATRESYSGEYHLVSRLSYGGFSTGDHQFYQTGSTVYIRLPWSWLNVTDPSQRIVLHNEGALAGQAKTVSTNGAIVSVLIADRQTGDQLYLFPETKQSPAYKTLQWSTWDTAAYTLREKDGYVLVKSYFASRTK